MFVDLAYRMFPFEVTPSTPFCEIPVGQLFAYIDPYSGKKKEYRLLYRDSWKVLIVEWNWFTKLWRNNRVAH